ncbi:MAG: UbiA family prenyltransferase [Pararhodobacter sp.]
MKGQASEMCGATGQQTTQDQTPRRVLAVDLDGTLICSDMLAESFWQAMAQDWSRALRALMALRRGRAALKAALAGVACPDPALLPYNPAVLAEIDAWRAAGGQVVLVSAADQHLAAAVAAHLGVFDAVHGSDGQRNLKGAEKAAFLRARYGAGGYVYIGDSAADLPVWAGACGAVTVGASASLRARLEAQQGPQPQGPQPRGAESPARVRHLPGGQGGARAALRAMRPHQWLKNLLVFAPMVAAQEFAAPALLQSLLAFAAFALVASSVYLLNDLLDLQADRAHPRKRERPLASGALALVHGMAMVPVLLVAGLALALALSPLFLAVLLGYYALTLAYSVWLKRKVLIDIFVLAALYALRVVAGAAATAIVLSVWLVAFSVFFFLALAAVKRQAELVDAAQRGLTDPAGRGYRLGDLPIVSQMAIASGFVAVLVMMLYLNSPEVLSRYSRPDMLWGACLVMLYWLARMVMVAHRGRMHDDPVVFAARDRVSLICFALMVALFGGASMP